MSQEVNTATKGKFTLIAGVFCALGGCCIGHTTGEAAGTSVVGAVIGFVVGYAGALISPLLGFGLILVASIAFWHSYTVWARPAPPEPRPLTEEEVNAALTQFKTTEEVEVPIKKFKTTEEVEVPIKKFKARVQAPVEAQQSPRPSATPTPNKVP
jgi:hypothetical protein